MNFTIDNEDAQKPILVKLQAKANGEINLDIGLYTILSITKRGTLRLYRGMTGNFLNLPTENDSIKIEN